MANIQSTLVSNDQAEPVVFNHVGLNGARLRSIIATAETSGTDGDTFVFCKLQPAWRIVHIWLHNDACSGGTGYDFGLASDASATAVDIDCYADGITLASARTSAPIDIAYSTRGIEKMGQYVYQDGGHTDSNKLSQYWLAGKGVTAGAASKTIMLNIQFTVD
tara:strand:- start:3477 stop:3965 length:489 start_codon:yes stop_codon:yes gene_type:complete